MDEWLNIVVRQLILYSLPVLVSLTCVTIIEAKFTASRQPHPFFALFWRGSWLPLLAALFFHRAIIIALPNPLQQGVKSSALRCSAHLLLCCVGFLLYAWSLDQQAPAGLPPLHYWWAKVMMFFNLCMVCLHLLPMPGLLMGELLLRSDIKSLSLLERLRPQAWCWFALLAASPLLDWSVGALMVFPLYEWLANSANLLF